MVLFLILKTKTKMYCNWIIFEYLLNKRELGTFYLPRSQALLGFFMKWSWNSKKYKKGIFWYKKSFYPIWKYFTTLIFISICKQGHKFYQQGGGATGWGIPLLYFSGWTCLEKSDGGQGLLEWDMPQPPKLTKLFC